VKTLFINLNLNTMTAPIIILLIMVFVIFLFLLQIVARCIYTKEYIKLFFWSAITALFIYLSLNFIL